MPYLVEFATRAIVDLEVLYIEKNASESRGAARWYNRLEQAVYALASHPLRCPLAPEAKKMKRTVRQLLYGDKPHIYRVIYEVDEERRAVRVLMIRHGARQRFKSPDLM